MTDKERADVLRKAADIMANNLDDETCDYMRGYADGLEAPLPKQGLIVFENGTHGCVLRGHMSVDHKWDIVTDFGELLTFDDALPFKPARILAPDEVAVTIPPVSDWPDNCFFVRVVLLFESETGRTLHEIFERIFDRKSVERIKGI